MPEEATTLLRESLERSTQSHRGGLAMTIAGLRARALDDDVRCVDADVRDDQGVRPGGRRGFVRKRLLALGIVLALGFGAALVLSLLVFGPHVERWVGGATGVPTLVAFSGGRSSGRCSSPASCSRSPSRSRSAPTSTSGAGNSSRRAP